MRLMLGFNDSNPDLLVEVDNDYNPSNFEFYVVNGAWRGKFANGTVMCVVPESHGHLGTSAYTDNDIDEDGNLIISSVDNFRIICDNQDRLSGSYDTVFKNFHNPDYIAPNRRPVRSKSWDDDIPF